MFDAVIQNGLVVDGTRARPYRASVYLKDGKIAEISEDPQKPAKTVYDAAGHVVAPGFIDIHSHSDVSYLATPTMEAKLIGGVTFELVGQCGISPIPICDRNAELTLRNQSSVVSLGLTPENFPARDMAGYAEDVERHGISINLGALIGHGSLRSYVIGWELRQLTPDELTQMCDLLDRMLEQGAAGVSFGLIYPPGSFCNTEEIVALARVVARHDKLLAVHMRNENKGVFDALDEMIGVALETGVKLEISHFKLMGSTQWGRADELLAKVDLARAKGVRIHCDQYPYVVSHSVLTSCLPKWAMAGGYDALVERLKDDKTFAKIIEGGLPEMYNRGGPENITVSEIPDAEYPEILNKTLVQIARELNLPLLEAIRHILIRCRGHIQCLYRCMDEGDLLRIMSRRDICACSDGAAYDLSRPFGHPHPRNTGTFPRFLRLVREHNLMPVEDAVYKITALPATLMGFGDRFGTLKPGYDATITVFDYDTIADRATYEEPTLPPVGIDFVLVNGQLVLDHGRFTENRPGKVLRA